MLTPCQKCLRSFLTLPSAFILSDFVDYTEFSEVSDSFQIFFQIASASTILRILEDERYIGSYVIGKRAVLEMGGTRSRMKDRDKWYIIPDHHPAIVEKSVFEKVQASQLRFSQPNKKKRDYPLKGKAFCGCCGHALSRTIQKTSYYYCRHSEADEESRCHKMRINAVELEKAVFITLKKQMEAAANLNPDGTVRLDAAAPERSEYEQQIEALQDGKRLAVYLLLKVFSIYTTVYSDVSFFSHFLIQFFDDSICLRLGYS